MAGVYTTRFIHGHGSGVRTSYTVPVGFRIVLTNVVAQAAGDLEKYWLLANGAYVRYWPAPGPSSAEYFATRLALYSGEVLAVDVQGSGMQVWATGYLFPDPGGTTKPGPDTDRELWDPDEPRPGWPE